jgi:hypothetical protein
MYTLGQFRCIQQTGSRHRDAMRHRGAERQINLIRTRHLTDA